MVKGKEKSWVSWSKDEVRLLKMLYPLGRAREIAEQTGRSLAAIRQKAYSMGIRTRDLHPWTTNEVKLLKKLYKDKDIQSIADKLERSLLASHLQSFFH